MSLSKVLTPIRLGGVEIPNRVVRTAHGTRFGGGLMTDDLIAYHALRAAGGVGLSILEIMSVHPTSPSGLNGFDPRIEEGYGRLLEQVRPHGMRLFQQIWHGGHHTLPLDGSPPWSASDIASPRLGVVPVAMTRAMIQEIQEAYVARARQCQAMGLDGVEIHCAHGYLIHQFLSPATNRRDDDYGGPFENRIRFLMEIVTAVRAALSRENFALGVRLAPDMSAGGWDAKDCLRLARLLDEHQLVDFINVSQGSYHAFDKMIGGMHEECGYQLSLSRTITRELGVPTIVTGRFRTLEEADQAIRMGDADLIGMTRATIAEPMLVKKTVSGQAEQVRPCIACNQGCVGNLLGPQGRMGCVVNPAVGHERQFGDHLLAPVSEARHVVVVGGGPAGMEAARVAAVRGHRVTLFEAQSRLGGALQLAAQAPTRHGLLDLTIWQEQELYRLGVEVKLNHFMDAPDVLELAPDAVIVATGSMPRLDGVQLANPGEPLDTRDGIRMLSSWDLFSDPAGVRGIGSAIVVDDLGHYEAVAVAEYLVAQGIQVHYVSRHPSFAPQMDSALMTEPALRRLSRGHFEMHLRSRVLRLDAEGAWIGPTYLGAEAATRHLAADLMVMVSPNHANRELYDALVGRVGEVKVVGDAHSPRQLQVAMREGFLAAAHL